MPADHSLKRLGGGRWETRDGRFAIEPQSGTWVVVDNTQTDELGLPLVRGPFGSLTAAREAIERAMSTGPAESPLAERIEQARKHADEAPAVDGGAGAAKGKAGKAASRRAAAKPAGRAAEPRTPAEPPASPPEPKWLRDLAPAERRRARELIERLENLDIPEPEAIARAEIARDQPALARLALERRVREAVESAKRPGDAARAVIDAILLGKDRELGARWRLVDDRGRHIDELDVTG